MYIGRVVLGRDHDLYLAGDFHRGSTSQSRPHVERFVADVRSNPVGKWVGMGDYIEALTVDDRRFDLDVEENLKPIGQYLSMKQDLEPIKDKNIGLLQGNHEYFLSRRIGEYLHDAWCPNWNVPYLTYTAVLQILDEDGKQLYKIFLWHGRGTIKSRIDDPGERLHSMLRALKRKLYLKMGDCLIMAMAHTHRLLLKRPETALALYSNLLLPEGHRVKDWYEGKQTSRYGYIQPSGRWYVNTGGFTRAYVEGVSTYVETGDHDPIELGYARVLCREGLVEDIEIRTEEVKEG